MPAEVGRRGGVVHLPGLWNHLRELHQQAHDEGDIRLSPVFTPELSEDERERLHNSPGSRRVTERRVLDRMDAGEPVIAVRWDVRKFTGAEMVSWLADLDEPRDVLVHPDDSVELIEDAAEVNSPTTGRRLRNPIV
ncbi:MAG: hypothetical protein P4L86_17670 [Mycobacterium sp.]|nr:hypothetical protein [Mycobacterium sp.]